MLEPAVDDLPRTSALGDEALVRNVLAGEVAQFAVLMRRHNRRVFRVARGILGSDAEAEDASQDAFVTAYERLEQLTAPAKFGGWVSRIAANAALLRLRRHRKLLALVERGEVTPMPDQSTETTPEQAAQHRELRTVLERAIDELPDIYRAVLVMRDVEAMTTAEVAEVLTIDIATVRVRLHRARRLMQQQLVETLDLAAADAFAFDGERCDRLVAAVFRRIGADEPSR